MGALDRLRDHRSVLEKGAQVPPVSRERRGFLGLGLFRARDHRILGGVAGGVGARLGVDPIVARIGFVMLALCGGVGAVAYLVLWAAVPENDGSAKTRPPGMRRAVAIGLVVLGIMILLREAGLWFGDALAFSIGLAGLGAAVIWLRSDDDERARWGRLTARGPEALPSLVRAGRIGKTRLVVGALLLASGVAFFLAASDALVAAPAVVLAVGATIAGLGLVFGPWAWRLAHQLAEERRERIRSQERTEMAAHLHDSVLQTLALIQRTDSARDMVALARGQERELRAWLSGKPLRRENSVAGAIESSAAAVELQFKVPVEVVTVGDVRLDERLQPIVDATREATINAAKHSGAERISVYVEVERDAVAAYVRDDGKGFDPAAVAADRRGIADSIRGRMERSGGSAVIVSEPGAGTEVQLALPMTS
jgi:signal transduction histidine kinase/phage shock protein PspC (stress-responsive transcriptional regulator)